LVHMLFMINYFGSYVISDTTATPRGYGSIYGFLAFLCFVTMFATAWEPIRRHLFELFRFTHYLAIPGVVLAFLHSRDFFYAGIVPFALYIIDFLIRTYRQWFRVGTVTATVINSDGVRITKLVCQIAPEFSYNAGDYAFISLPQVSTLQWHPFSMSSAPGDANHTFTFHILDMGPGTFTHDIAEHADKLTTIRIDGPYGKLGVPVAKYENIFLAAGGIGITPLISLLDDLCKRHQRGQMPQLKTVTLVWTCKHRGAFDSWFPEVLKRVSTANSEHSKVTFELKLFVTAVNKAETEMEPIKLESLPVIEGRPKYDELLDAIVQREAPFTTAVLACGPQNMVADVQSAALARSLHFHKETFIL